MSVKYKLIDKMLRNARQIVIFLVFVTLLVACKKYLDAKPDQKLSTPDTIEDLQALLDNGDLYTALMESNTATDEYYVTNADWLSSPQIHQESYVWNLQATTDFVANHDWTYAYKSIFAANSVLDNLERVSVENQQKWNNVKGSALFIRAHNFYMLAQIYAKQYDANTGTTDLGIPLRLTSDFNKPSVRASVQQMYDQILEDLKSALPLLPDVPQFATRPSRAATFALLARVNLTMGNFTECKMYSDSCLNLYNFLYDYKDNTLNLSASAPFPALNKEVIYHAWDRRSLNTNSTAKIDSNLYASFQSNDLRKTGFFSKNSDGSFRFKGTYAGNVSRLFCGIATDEIYLMRAECYARLGNTTDAIKDLNALLSKRYNATFVPVTATSSNAALVQILNERKKELIYRCLRWTDLRRLNKESQFQVTLTRILGSNVYTLPPNDPRYVFLIPQDAIRLSGIQQNTY
jgi:tetratricopeptide (TPR) repeat protein